MKPALFLPLMACIVAVHLPAAGDARITYSKVFKGSVPEFVVITLDRSGQGTFKDSPDEPNPLQFQLRAEDTAEIFDLTAKLGQFSRPLESDAKVANMGRKTFRYEESGTTHEVSFNYSSDASAQALADWFERISETEEEYYGLEQALKFDHLGVNDALLHIQTTYDKKRLVAPQQFLPLLDRVSKNEALMHLARERAAMLAEAFRSAAEVSQRAPR